MCLYPAYICWHVSLLSQWFSIYFFRFFFSFSTLLRFAQRHVFNMFESLFLFLALFFRFIHAANTQTRGYHSHWCLNAQTRQKLWAKINFSSFSMTFLFVVVFYICFLPHRCVICFFLDVFFPLYSAFLNSNIVCFSCYASPALFCSFTLQNSRRCFVSWNF